MKEERRKSLDEVADTNQNSLRGIEQSSAMTQVFYPQSEETKEESKIAVKINYEQAEQIVDT